MKAREIARERRTTLDQPMKKRRVVRGLKFLAVAGALLAAAACLILQTAPFGGRFEGERLGCMKRSAQFMNGRFENVPPQDTDNSPLELCVSIRRARSGSHGSRCR